MKLIPKRKVAAKEFPEFEGDGDIISYMSNLSEYFNQTSQYITNLSQNIQYLNTFIRVISEFGGTLDDILDGIIYGRVLQTNLSSGALKIITAQSDLLDLIAATDITSNLGSSSKYWHNVYTENLVMKSGDIIPLNTDECELGYSTKEFEKGYVKKMYMDTRCQIPVGTDMYD